MDFIYAMNIRHPKYLICLIGRSLAGRLICILTLFLNFAVGKFPLKGKSEKYAK